MVGTNSHDVNLQGITSTTWQKISNSGGCNASFGGSGFMGLAQGPCNNWSVYTKITATNSCGTTTIYRTITPPPPGPCDDNFRFTQNPIKKGSLNSRIIIDPCDDFNRVKSDKNEESHSISIFNNYGDRVYQKNQKEKEFNISILKRGLYFVKYRTRKGNIITKKLIVE